ncbi:MAG TPA: hypothetical protein VHC19_28200 [Pirellulales bacterium]|nr:hypothetical protein [Pirellulales bacterium]
MPLSGRRLPLVPRLEFWKFQRGELGQRRFNASFQLFEAHENLVLPGFKFGEQANSCRRRSHSKLLFLSVEKQGGGIGRDRVSHRRPDGRDIIRDLKSQGRLIKSEERGACVRGAGREDS